MQNKTFIKVAFIVMGILCLYRLYFTWMGNVVRDEAKAYAYGDKTEEIKYLDSLKNEPVLNMGVRSYTYLDILQRELNLGLDLKGGVNVMLEISVKDVLLHLTSYSKNPTFIASINEADQKAAGVQDDYLDLFFNAFGRRAKESGVDLSDLDVFGNKRLRDRIRIGDSPEKIKQVVSDEVDRSIDQVFTVLRTRIDKFGVTQPNIQKVDRLGRIMVELPGVKNPDRVKNLLKASAKLEFWEAYYNQDVFDFLIQTNTLLQKEALDMDQAEMASGTTDKKTPIDDKKSQVSLLDSLTGGELGVDDRTAGKNKNPLFDLLQPTQQKGAVIGYAKAADAEKVMAYFKRKDIRSLLPSNLRFVQFLWGTASPSTPDVLALYALKSNRRAQAALFGDVIESARQDYDTYSRPAVSMQMNSRASKVWEQVTGRNKDRCIAIVLDNRVYSAPVVNQKISDGRSQISGSFTVEEAKDLANILKAGKLPVPTHVIHSEVVGPSLGQEAVSSGMISFFIALLAILMWMIFYYSKPGLYAGIALLVNILYIFGILASMGAALTLPGIAGIVLTIGMSVDANVLIYERIKEELKKTDSLRKAVADGYNNAYTSILDANITTLLTGIILYAFGTGPIQGFATTLIIGILTSLASAIFVSRLLIESDIDRGKSLSFSTSMTKNWFQSFNANFIPNRKKAYVISSVFILVGIISLAFQGLNRSIDFVGGYSFVVRFDHPVSTQKVAEDLSSVFVEEGRKLFPEVKTFGQDNQVKITTKYRVNDPGDHVDREISQMIYEKMQGDLPSGMSFATFNDASIQDREAGLLSSTRVGPTVANDIKIAAYYSLIFSIIVIFLYILARFRKWQFSMAAIVAIVHDVLVVLSIFSIFYAWDIMPFSLEVDQAFIAAMLTVIGYSLNDTVIIFDRIREVSRIDKLPIALVTNKALNKTMSRTLNTSITTFVTTLIIFMLGGENIKGFMFAIMIGVVVGTYSSIFIASPILVDTSSSAQDKVSKLSR